MNRTLSIGLSIIIALIVISVISIQSTAVQKFKVAEQNPAALSILQDSIEAVKQKNELKRDKLVLLESKIKQTELEIQLTTRQIEAEIAKIRNTKQKSHK